VLAALNLAVSLLKLRIGIAIAASTVAGAGGGETPEMRRRPKKQHNRENDRHYLRCRIDGRGACEHRKAACEPANNNVPRGPPLEPDGVDDAIDEAAKEHIDGAQRPAGRVSERE
jgi:hypothetical protein